MKYTKPEFVVLMDEAEAQGCLHLDKVCGDTIHTFPGKRRPFKSRGCHEVAIFEIPYEKPDGELGTIELCAVDDDLGRTARFGGDRFGREEPNA